jgi:hypothetical protein
VLLLLCAAGTLTQAEEQGKATQQNAEIESEVCSPFHSPIHSTFYCFVTHGVDDVQEPMDERHRLLTGASHKVSPFFPGLFFFNKKER